MRERGRSLRVLSERYGWLMVPFFIFWKLLSFFNFNVTYRNQNPATHNTIIKTIISFFFIIYMETIQALHKPNSS